jgi:hypothetical protein
MEIIAKVWLQAVTDCVVVNTAYSIPCVFEAVKNLLFVYTIVHWGIVDL